MRALVIQSEPLEGINVTDVLVEEGFTVDQLEGPAAAGFLDGPGYAICVLDLDIPGFDGLSLLRKWRAQGRILPVLAVSAVGGWFAKVTAIEAGADDYLAKPIIYRSLLRKIYSII